MIEIVRVRAVALVSVAALLPFAASAAESDALLEATESGHYATALSSYEAAAERGDRTAQQIAGLMLHYGETLYGSEVHRDPRAAKRYLAMAAAQESEVAKFMLKTIAAKDTQSARSGTTRLERPTR